MGAGGSGAQPAPRAATTPAGSAAHRARQADGAPATRPGTTAYATSKGGLKMLTKGMAVDLGPHGITVNGIAPGYFRTELTAPLANDEKASSWIAGHTPVGRWGELEELAPAVVFLASDAARYVNGHVLVIDGGMTATL